MNTATETLELIRDELDRRCAVGPNAKTPEGVKLKLTFGELNQDPAVRAAVTHGMFTLPGMRPVLADGSIIRLNGHVAKVEEYGVAKVEECWSATPTTFDLRDDKSYGLIVDLLSSSAAAFVTQTIVYLNEEPEFVGRPTSPSIRTVPYHEVTRIELPEPVTGDRGNSPAVSNYELRRDLTMRWRSSHRSGDSISDFRWPMPLEWAMHQVNDTWGSIHSLYLERPGLLENLRLEFAGADVKSLEDWLIGQYRSDLDYVKSILDDQGSVVRPSPWESRCKTSP